MGYLYLTFVNGQRLRAGWVEALDVYGRVCIASLAGERLRLRFFEVVKVEVLP